jgi:antitoxin CptB
MREMDLLLGPFADMHLPSLSELELESFEALLDLPDPELYGWIAGGEPVPHPHRSPLLAAIISFHHSRP